MLLLMLFSESITASMQDHKAIFEMILLETIIIGNTNSNDISSKSLFLSFYFGLQDISLTAGQYLLVYYPVLPWYIEL
jgi:hypothetical protein